LSHRHTFSRKIIPATDKRLDEEDMSRLKTVINVILGVDGMLSLRLATDCSGADKTMTFICDLLCKVIDELGPENIFSVVMDGTCKGAFPLNRDKYPHVQCCYPHESP
jgi:hypothetical protein